MAQHWSEGVSSLRFTPREFQQELLQAAVAHNVLSCPPSSAASFVGLKLLQELAHQIRWPSERRSVVLTPLHRLKSVAYDISLLTDLSAVASGDTENQQLSEESVRDNQVLVLSSAVLCASLEEGVLSIDRINLLVIEECHSVAVDTRLQKIMMLYSKWKDEHGENSLVVPRILAFTYPLFTQDTFKDSSGGENFTIPITKRKKRKNKATNVNSGELLSHTQTEINTDVIVEEVKDKDLLNNFTDPISDSKSGDLDSTMSDFNYWRAEFVDISDDITKVEIELELGTMEQELDQSSDDEVDDEDRDSGANGQGFESLVYDKLEYQLEKLEKMLHCKADMAPDIVGLKKITGRPREVILECKRNLDIHICEDRKKLQTFMKNTVETALLFLEDHRYDPTEIYGDEAFGEELRAIPDPCLDPRAMLEQFLYILDETGPYGADKAAFHLLIKIEKLKVKIPYERHFLLLCLITSILIQVRAAADLIFEKYDCDKEKIQKFTTPKVLRLMEIFELFKPTDNGIKSCENSPKIILSERNIPNSSVKTIEACNNPCQNPKEDVRALGNTVNKCENFKVSGCDFKKDMECMGVVKDMESHHEGLKISKIVINVPNATSDDQSSLKRVEALSDKYVYSGAKNKCNELNLPTKSSLIDSCDSKHYIVNLNNFDTMLDSVNSLEDIQIVEPDYSIGEDGKKINALKQLESCNFKSLEQRLGKNYEAILDEPHAGREISNKRKCDDKDHIGCEYRKKIAKNITELTEGQSQLEGAAVKYQNIEIMLEEKQNHDSYADMETKDADEMIKVIQTILVEDAEIECKKIGETQTSNVINSNVTASSIQKYEVNSFDNAFIEKSNQLFIRDSQETFYANVLDGRIVTKGHRSTTEQDLQEKETRIYIVDSKNSDKQTPVHSISADLPDARRPEGYMKFSPRKKNMGNFRGRGRGRGGRGSMGSQQRYYNGLNDPDALCGLIFVEEPLLAKILCSLIGEYCRLDPELQYVVPQFTVAKVADPQSEPREAENEHRLQEEVLKRFRTHECNLLVGTSVLEEGMDLPKCNLVVRWDPPKGYRCHARCRSRARAPRSLYTLLAPPPSESLISALAHYTHIERMLVKKCSWREPGPSEEAHAALFSSLILPYRPSMAAATLSTAVQLLNRYCAKLPSDTFTRLVPSWSTEQLLHRGRTLFICTIRLPINCPLKEHIVGHPMPTRVLARRIAALQACRALHLYGELDDNLLPIGKEMFRAMEPDWLSLPPASDLPDLAGIEPRPGTTKRKQYYYKKVARALSSCRPVVGRPCLVYSVRARLACPLPERHNTRGRRLHPPEAYKQGFAILTEEPIHEIPVFPMFTRSGEVRVRLVQLPEKVVLSHEREIRVHRFMRYTFSDVLRVHNHLMIFDEDGKQKRNSYYIVPTTKITGTDGESVVVDWEFLELIYEHTNNLKNLGTVESKVPMPVLKVENKMPFAEEKNIDKINEEVNDKTEKDNKVEICPETRDEIKENGKKKIEEFTEVLKLAAEEKVLVINDINKENCEDKENNKVIKKCESTEESNKGTDNDEKRIAEDAQSNEKGKNSPDESPKNDAGTPKEKSTDVKAEGRDEELEMPNPFLKSGEVFQFDSEKFRDAVVMPWYRNQDQPQYFYVAEICWHLSPRSAFPSTAHATFEDYYQHKYGVRISQPKQPLLDVDHTSARLNLLTPRFVNRKGVALPTSSERTKKAKRESLEQKQILVPELCGAHPFRGALWRAAVALPCVLYRINSLLLADEIRRSVALCVALGTPRPRSDFLWPPLDFGWSLADVLAADKETEQPAEKTIEDKKDDEKHDIEEKAEEDTAEKNEKKANELLKEKEEAPRDGDDFEVGMWSNDMAASVPLKNVEDKDDSHTGKLPSNIGNCPSVDGGADWSLSAATTPRSPARQGQQRKYSVADSDASYVSSEFDTSDDDSNSSDNDDTDEADATETVPEKGGIRIEFKSINEAEAIDVIPPPLCVPSEAELAAARLAEERSLQAFRDYFCGGAEEPAAKEHIKKFHQAIAANRTDIIKNGILVPHDMSLDTIKSEDFKSSSESDIFKSPVHFVYEAPDDLPKDANVESCASSPLRLKTTNKTQNILEEHRKTRDGLNNGVKCTNAVETINHQINEEHDKVIIASEIPLTVQNNTESKNSVNLDLKMNIVNDFLHQENAKEDKVNPFPAIYEKALSKNEILELYKEMFPCEECPTENDDPCNFGLLRNGSVHIEDLEENKRRILEEVKRSMPKEEWRKFNFFAMKDLYEENFEDGYKDLTEKRREQMKSAEAIDDNEEDFKNVEKKSNGPSFSFDYQPDLNNHPGPSPSVILQALTMSNANDGINLERLETIGDSFLKYAITTYLYCTYQNIHEGKLSHLRSKQVSNLNLYRLGRRKSLGCRMVACKFEPHDNWLPPCHRVPPHLERALIDTHIPSTLWNVADIPPLANLSKEKIEQIVREKVALQHTAPFKEANSPRNKPKLVKTINEANSAKEVNEKCPIHGKDSKDRGKNEKNLPKADNENKSKQITNGVEAKKKVNLTDKESISKDENVENDCKTIETKRKQINEKSGSSNETQKLNSIENKVEKDETKKHSELNGIAKISQSKDHGQSINGGKGTSSQVKSSTEVVSNKSIPSKDEIKQIISGSSQEQDNPSSTETCEASLDKEATAPKCTCAVFSSLDVSMTESESTNNGDPELQTVPCFVPYNLITQHSIPDKSVADCVEALIGAYLIECGPRGALLFMAWLGIRVLPMEEITLNPDHPFVIKMKEAAINKINEQTAANQDLKKSNSSRYDSNTCDRATSEKEDLLSESEEKDPYDKQDDESDFIEDDSWNWEGRTPGSLKPTLNEKGEWVQVVYGELKPPPSPLLRLVPDPEGELMEMLSGYEGLERILGYRFKDRCYLLQAMTHASHSPNRLTDCYQRLEFLGDAVLDYLITRQLYEDPRRHSPGALTDLRSALVNNTIFASLAVRHGMHKYFRHLSPGLHEVLARFVQLQEQSGHAISEEHFLLQEDECEQAEDVEVPKALGDLFESVAGAIFLDSGMSLDAVWRVYAALMRREIDAFSEAVPKSPVRELLEMEPETAKFGKPEKLADGRRVRVTVEVLGAGAFKGVGRNYRIAKCTAAKCALRHLANKPRTRPK